MIHQIAMLAAIDFSAVIIIIAGVISFISWLVNQANAAKNVPPPRNPNRPPPARNPQVQREIERFLRQAAGQPERPVVAVDEIEIVDSPPVRRPPVKRKLVEKPRPSGAVRPAPRPGSTAAAKRPGQQFADRHLAAAPKSAVAHEHLAQGRVASEHLPEDVAKSVSAHLGVFAAADARAVKRRSGGISSAVLAELRTRRGMRSAFIMQEILQRPRSLRRPAP